MKNLTIDVLEIRKRKQYIIEGIVESADEAKTVKYIIEPMFKALGYDFSDPSECVPEAVTELSRDKKNGKRADFLIKVNGQPTIILECKAITQSVTNNDYINQISGYYASMVSKCEGIKTVILTNGNDYHFFTDSKKPNVLDTEPYLTFNLETATDLEIEELDKFSKQNISKLDIKADTKIREFRDECEIVATGMLNNNIPQYLIKAIRDQVGLEGGRHDMSQLANILYETMKSKINGYTVVKGIEDGDIMCYLRRKSFNEIIEGKAVLHTNGKMTLLKGSDVSEKIADMTWIKGLREQYSRNIKEKVLIQDIENITPSEAATLLTGCVCKDIEWKDGQDKSIKKYLNSKESEEKEASTIRLNHEYVFNDYSDGNWTKHRLSYALIGEKRYELSAIQVLLRLITYLINEDSNFRQTLLTSEEFKDRFRISDTKIDNSKYIEEYSLWVYSKFSITDIVRFMEKVLRVANKDYSLVKFSFES